MWAHWYHHKRAISFNLSGRHAAFINGLLVCRCWRKALDADCWATGPKAPYLGRPGEKSSGFGGPPTQLMSQALSTVMKSNVPSFALVHASCTIFFGT